MQLYANFLFGDSPLFGCVTILFLQALAAHVVLEASFMVKRVGNFDHGPEGRFELNFPPSRNDRSSDRQSFELAALPQNLCVVLSRQQGCRLMSSMSYVCGKPSSVGSPKIIADEIGSSQAHLNFRWIADEFEIVMKYS